MTSMKMIQKTSQFTLSIFIGILITFNASAAIKSAEPQEYKFKFNLKGDIYQYQQKSASYEEAFERAAKACFNHYKTGKKLNEDQGLDIIDVCANPRSS